jgi:hypothetical protein
MEKTGLIFCGKCMEWKPALNFPLNNRKTCSSCKKNKNSKRRNLNERKFRGQNKFGGGRHQC